MSCFQRKFGQVVLLGGLLVAARAECRAQGTAIHTVAVAPTTFTLTSVDPDAGTVTGSGAAALSFRTTSGTNARAWTVQAQANLANFATCPAAVPASAVKLTCSSATVTNGGSGTCAAQVSLGTGLQQLASGLEGTGNAAYSLSINVNMVFSAGWSNIPTATPCTLNISYQIVAN